MSLALLAVCLTIGAQPFVRPDQACTPGDTDRLTTAEVCTPKTRPALAAADRRRILARYGYATWTGANGELDHRIPVFLGGRTDVRNVWPEPGPIPNRKDRLESYVYNRICTWRTMRPRYAVHIFAGNWTLYSKRYGL
jgi:hypothetical protein